MNSIFSGFSFLRIELVGDVKNKCSSVSWLRVTEAPGRQAELNWNYSHQTKCCTSSKHPPLTEGERQGFFLLILKIVFNTLTGLCTTFAIAFFWFSFQ